METITFLFVCLFIDGPISGPTSYTHNAGAERLCSVKVSRGPVSHFYFNKAISIYIYMKERCLFVCLFVTIWSQNYWMDFHQSWHGPPP